MTKSSRLMDFGSSHMRSRAILAAYSVSLQILSVLPTTSNGRYEDLPIRSVNGRLDEFCLNGACEPLDGCARCTFCP
jgi:hypothetical protein